MRCGVLLIPLMLVLSSSANANPIKLDFANGFAGWDVSIPTGTSSATRSFGQTLPAGTATTTDAFRFLGVDGTQTVDALSGSMALIGSNDAGTFSNPDNQTWDIVVSRTISLVAGQSVAGSAFFYNGDFEAQDTGWVRIMALDGSLIAQLWTEASGSSAEAGSPPSSVPYRAATAWTSWDWQATATGDYVLALGMTTGGDNVFASRAGFDDIRTVPEPATGLLLTLGVVALGMRRFANH